MTEDLKPRLDALEHDLVQISARLADVSCRLANVSIVIAHSPIEVRDGKAYMHVPFDAYRMAVETGVTDVDIEGAL